LYSTCIELGLKLEWSEINKLLSCLGPDSTIMKAEMLTNDYTFSMLQGTMKCKGQWYIQDLTL